MSGRRRALVPALLVVAVVVASIALTGGLGARPEPTPLPRPGASGLAQGSGDPAETAIPTPRPPLGGTESYGYLPYWQMTDAVADHLRSTPVSTIGLFSVTARRDGELNTKPRGYSRITGEIGRRLIREAHDRGARVDLVFTSFGALRNGRFFGSIDVPPVVIDPSPGTSFAPGAFAPWRQTVPKLVALAVELGVDGISVDIEQLSEIDRASYAAFLKELRSQLRGQVTDARLTVATEAGERGVANAAAAAAAGVDRIFLMGYDYHWSGSPPGASSPVDRLDGVPTLRWSITRYVEAGVPRDRLLLGLPLYGMTWRTTGPDRFFPVIGDGIAWVPSENLDLIREPAFTPTRDELEVADWFSRPDATAEGEWLVTYFDSPETLRAKLGLARDQGLAGGGLWALGYDRGLPGYGNLMRDFADGEVGRDEAPPNP